MKNYALSVSLAAVLLSGVLNGCGGEDDVLSTAQHALTEEEEECAAADDPDAAAADLEFAAAIAPNPTLTQVAIVGVGFVVEGKHAQYKLRLYFSNSTTTVVTTGPTWSENSGFATISSSGYLTASQVSTSNKNVTVTASYTHAGVTRSDTHPIKIIDKDIDNTKSLVIEGSSSSYQDPFENGTHQYKAKATFFPGLNTEYVTLDTIWSENSSFATISSGGLLTTSSVTADKTARVTASYTYNGITRVVRLPITIRDRPTFTIEGPATIHDNSYTNYQAVLHFTDGTTQNCTLTSDWVCYNVYIGWAHFESDVTGRLHVGDVVIGSETFKIGSHCYYYGVSFSGEKWITVVE